MGALCSHSQGKTVQLEVPIDTIRIEQRDFDAQRIERYLDSGDFDYAVEEKEPSLFEKLWIWIKRSIKDFLEFLFDDIGDILGFLSWFFKALPYVILVIALLLIVRFFVNVEGRTLLKKSNAVVAEFSTDEELMQSDNIEALLNEALADKNWRLAIRYYYLLTLQQFSNKQWIQWQQEKTNDDYIRELEGKSVQDDFVKSTRLYDFVWYGKFDINAQEFDMAKNRFQKLLGKHSG